MYKILTLVEECIKEQFDKLRSLFSLRHTTSKVFSSRKERERGNINNLGPYIKFVI